MADDTGVSDGRRDEHRRQIIQEHQKFVGELNWFVDRLYVDHFTDEDLRGSSDYTTIIEAADRLKQLALVKYRP